MVIKNRKLPEAAAMYFDKVRLISCLKVHEPEKLDRVEKLLEQYSGREDVMFLDMEAAYSVNPTKPWLIEFYEFHNPEKLDSNHQHHVNSILEKYKGWEDHLFFKLSMKYSPSSSSTSTAIVDDKSKTNEDRTATTSKENEEVNRKPSAEEEKGKDNRNPSAAASNSTADLTTDNTTVVEEETIHVDAKPDDDYSQPLPSKRKAEYVDGAANEDADDGYNNRSTKHQRVSSDEESYNNEEAEAVDADADADDWFTEDWLQKQQQKCSNVHANLHNAYDPSSVSDDDDDDDDNKTDSPPGPDKSSTSTGPVPPPAAAVSSSHPSSHTPPVAGNLHYTENDDKNVKWVMKLFAEKPPGFLYILLNIKKNATRKEIKRAWTRLQKKVHTDKNNAPSAKEASQKVNGAKDIYKNNTISLDALEANLRGVTGFGENNNDNNFNNHHQQHRSPFGFGANFNGFRNKSASSTHHRSGNDSGRPTGAGSSPFGFGFGTNYNNFNFNNHRQQQRPPPPPPPPPPSPPPPMNTHCHECGSGFPSGSQRDEYCGKNCAYTDKKKNRSFCYDCHIREIRRRNPVHAAKNPSKQCKHCGLKGHCRATSFKCPEYWKRRQQAGLHNYSRGF